MRQSLYFRRYDTDYNGIQAGAGGEHEHGRDTAASVFSSGVKCRMMNKGSADGKLAEFTSVTLSGRKWCLIKGDLSEKLKEEILADETV